MVSLSFLRHALTCMCMCLCMTIVTVMARPSPLPYSLGIRDSLMIAHSFHDNPAFGPAGGLHGATYTVDVEFATAALNEDTNWVMDIGKASSIVEQVLQKYNFKNMDQVFSNNELTTTEFMAKTIHADICQRLRSEECNFAGELSVKLWESHKAWATFRDKV